MGALVKWVLGKLQHDNLLQDPQPYLGVRGALPVLLLFLLGLSFGLDLWGAFGAAFCPGPSVGVAWTSSSAIHSRSIFKAFGVSLLLGRR